MKEKKNLLSTSHYILFVCSNFFVFVLQAGFSTIHFYPWCMCVCVCASIASAPENLPICFLTCISTWIYASFIFQGLCDPLSTLAYYSITWCNFARRFAFFGFIFFFFSLLVSRCDAVRCMLKPLSIAHHIVDC